MSQTTSNAAAPQNADDAAQQQREPAYNVLGTVSSYERRTDRNGKPYGYLKFHCTLGGTTRDWTTMLFGKMMDMEPKLKAGGSMRLFVKIDGGKTLVIVGEGRPLLTDEEKAARRAARQQPASEGPDDSLPMAA